MLSKPSAKDILNLVLEKNEILTGNTAGEILNFEMKYLRNIKSLKAELDDMF